MIENYRTKFHKGQGMFQGERKTYEPREGHQMLHSEEKNDPIETTVDEQLDYLASGLNSAVRYINAVLNQEATNASGTVTAELIVRDKSWGKVSSLELLRLKNILESFNLYDMYNKIPVRPQNIIWKRSTDPEHAGQNIWANKLIETTKMTTITEPYILHPAEGEHPAIVAERKTPIPIGDGTFQKFHSGWSQHEKANLLSRFTDLKIAVKEALSRANEADTIESNINGEKLFNFIHRGLEPVTAPE